MMTDASYRLNAEGKMYCQAEFDVNKQVMGFPVRESSDFEIIIGAPATSPDGKSKTVEVFFSGNGTGNEFVFEASNGATFIDGGCRGRRSLLSGGLLKIPADASDVVVKAAWGKCSNAPLYPCQIYMTSEKAQFARPQFR